MIKLYKDKFTDLSEKKLHYFELLQDVLENDGVVVLPTDTSYGFSCFPSSIKALKRVYELKSRGKSKPCILLFHSYEKIKEYFDLDEGSFNQLIDYKNNQKERAITFLLSPKKGMFGQEVTCGFDKLACRVPEDEFLIELLSFLNKPLISTSANVSFNPPAYLYNDFIKQFLGKGLPDLMVVEDKNKKVPVSQIVELKENKEINIIRA